MPYDKDLRDLIKATDKASNSLGESIEHQRKKLRIQREAREKRGAGGNSSAQAEENTLTSS